MGDVWTINHGRALFFLQTSAVIRSWARGHIMSSGFCWYDLEMQLFDVLRGELSQCGGCCCARCWCLRVGMLECADSREIFWFYRWMPSWLTFSRCWEYRVWLVPRWSSRAMLGEETNATIDEYISCYRLCIKFLWVNIGEYVPLFLSRDWSTRE